MARSRGKLSSFVKALIMKPAFLIDVWRSAKWTRERWSTLCVHILVSLSLFERFHAELMGLLQLAAYLAFGYAPALGQVAARQTVRSYGDEDVTLTRRHGLQHLEHAV